MERDRPLGGLSLHEHVGAGGARSGIAPSLDIRGLEVRNHAFRPRRVGDDRDDDHRAQPKRQKHR